MSADWESTIYDTPNQTRSIEPEAPDFTNIARPTRLRITTIPKPRFDDLERGDLSPETMSTVRSELPASPEITPSPSKRWSTATEEETSPTRTKTGSLPQAFRFGLPGATELSQDLEEYPFNAQVSASAYESNVRRLHNHSPAFGQKEKADRYPGTISGRSLVSSVPARRTLRKYSSILFGCMMIVATVRLFPGFVGMSGGLQRHGPRYVDSRAGEYGLADAGVSHDLNGLSRRRLKSAHASQERLASDYRSDAEAELLQVEEDMKKGSDWAWKPAVKDQEGLYVLDELEEDESSFHVQPSRTEEEYEEIERQISQKNVFSSLTSVQARRSRGRPDSRLEGLETAEILALRQLEERNRVASLRALVAFIGGGAEFPEGWIEEGSQGEALTAAIESAWTDADGNGLEGAFKRLIGKRSAAEVFPRGWKSDVDDHTKLVIFSKVSSSQS